MSETSSGLPENMPATTVEFCGTRRCWKKQAATTQRQGGAETAAELLQSDSELEKGESREVIMNGQRVVISRAHGCLHTCGLYPTAKVSADNTSGSERFRADSAESVRQAIEKHTGISLSPNAEPDQENS